MLDQHRHLPGDVDQETVEALLDELAADPAVSGILLQLPTPKHLDSDALVARIPAEKDVDGLSTANAGLLLQGRPGLPGRPKPAGQRAAPLPLTKPRQAMFGQFSAADRWLTIADAYEDRGETQDAVAVLRAGLRAHPNDPALLVGLGNALVDHAGMLTPAATIAFERSQVSSLVRQARAHLGEVEAAEARVRDGTYGSCAGCGGAVEPARLEARPTARTCVTCAGLPPAPPSRGAVSRA